MRQIELFGQRRPAFSWSRVSFTLIVMASLAALAGWTFLPARAVGEKSLATRGAGLIRSKFFSPAATTSRSSPVNNSVVNLGPFGGSVSSLISDPTNAQNLYAGVGHGFYKSTNAGASWFPVEDGLSLSGGNVAAGAVSVSNPSILFISIINAGLFKSTDGGAHWTAIPFGSQGGLFSSVNGLSIDSGNSSVVYAGGLDSVYKSTNGGTSWSKLNLGQQVFGISRILIDPTNSSTIYAASPNSSNGLVFKSVNAGTSWTSSAASQGSFGGLANLTFGPASTTTLYGNNGNLIYKSSDAGASWSNVGFLPNNFFVTSFMIDLSNPNTFYMGSRIDYTRPGSGGEYRSTDGGQSWLKIDSGLDNPNITVNLINGTGLYLGSEGGICKSTNAGNSWTDTDVGVTSLQINEIKIGTANPQLVYIGTFGKGVFKSTNGGTTWVKMNSGLANVYVKALDVDSSNEAVVYAGTERGLFKSSDGGNNWILQNVSAFSDKRFFSVAVDPHHPLTVYSTANYQSPTLIDFGNLLRSTDGGANWTQVKSFSQSYITRVIVDPVNSANAYFATIRSNRGVFKSTDSGLNWTASNSGLPAGDVLALALAPLSPSTLFVGIDTGGFVNSCYKTTNAGGGWQDSSTNGLAQPLGVTTITVDPTNSSVLYATALIGTSGSLFKSTTGGSSWTKLEDISPFTIVVHSTNVSELYLGTERGVVLLTQNASPTPSPSPSPSPSPPAISDISPSTVNVNQPTTLTVNGSNFQSGFAATVSSAYGSFPIASAGLTFVNGGQVKVNVTMGGIPPFPATLRITNPDQQSGTGAFQVISPTAGPSITGLDPATVVVNQSRTLNVNGSNFKAGFKAQVTSPSGTVDIASEGLTFVNGNQVKVQVLMTGTPPYNASLKIINPDQQTSSRSFSVVAAAPGPSITQIDPPAIEANQVATLTVNGANFQQGFTAEITNTSGTVPILSGGRTFVNSGQVKLQVMMTDPPPYSATLRIKNPDQQSATKDFQVVASIQPQPPAPVSVMAVEATQGIQDLRNSVVLIEGKRTFIKIHVRSTGADLPNVWGQLIVTRVSGSQRTELLRKEAQLTVRRNPVRDSQSDSFLFELDGTLCRGKLEIQFKGINFNFTAPKTEVNFFVTPPLQLKLISVVWRGASAFIRPAEQKIRKVEEAIKQAFPISTLQITRGQLLWSNQPHPNLFTPAELIEINARLLHMRLQEGCVSANGCKTFYVGLIDQGPNPGSCTDPNGCASGVAQFVQPNCDPAMRGVVAVSYVPPSAESFPSSPVHEFAHLLGRFHSDYNAQRHLEPAEEGFCAHDPSDGTIGGAGRYSYAADTLYGFDGANSYRSGTADLMSYGFPNWISKFTYTRIWDRISSLTSAPAFDESNVRARENVVAAGDPSVIITGSILLAAGTGSIASIETSLALVSSPAPDPGSYAIRFENNLGVELASYSFNPDVPSQGSMGVFALMLPWNANTSKVVLLHNGQIIDSKTSSAHGPVVTVTYPNGGESLQGSLATLQWTASDADSDPITFTVQYSVDAGLMWQTLSTNLSSTNYDLDLTAVGGTNQGLVRVLASDGFSTSQDRSDGVFSINRHNPMPSIQSPDSGTIYVGDQLFVLSGSGFDVDDGQLGDDALTWSSSLNGSLGSGHTLTVDVSTLLEGTHAITLSARDGDGQIGTASINVQVSRTRPALPASIAVTPAVLNFSIGQGTTQTAAEVIAIRNSGDGALNWSAIPNQNWIKISAASGMAPTNLMVWADPTGLAVGQYTGQVNITTSDANNGPKSTVITLNVLSAKTLQFAQSSNFVVESDGSALVAVTRAGDLSQVATVDYLTSDDTARQRRDYTIASGTLTFNPGEVSKSLRILVTDNVYVDSDRVVNISLSNSTGAIPGVPGSAVLTITDNDSTTPTTNPLDNADERFFVRQHYYDFLSRLPDQGGFDFWAAQITQCGNDSSCVRTKRVDVSNAFYYELEFQQTASYVYRLYRAAFGNNQPFPNPNPDPAYPGEEKKIPLYATFMKDRAVVRGGSQLAQLQLNLATSFVQRSEFLAKYPNSLSTAGQFVDALLGTLQTDIGVNLGSERDALINLFNTGGRAAVLYRLADDNVQTNPINNRAFIDAEYNRAFVATQYFGYLRRNPDIGGFVFWLNQVNGGPLRDVGKQHAMVCSFITSAEYQLRFSSVVTHNNTECPQ